MNSPPAHSSSQVFARLLGYVKPYWKVFAISVLCMVGVAATEPVFPELLKRLLRDFGRADQSAVVWIPLGIVLLFALRGALTFTQSYSLAWLSNRLITDLRGVMFARLVSLPTPFFDNQSSGVLLSKVAYDVGGVASAAGNVLQTAVRDTLTALGLTAYLFYLSWKLTLIAIVVIPITAMVVKAFSGRLRRAARNAQSAMGRLAQVLEESIGAHKVVKVFGGQDYEKRRFAHANEALRGFNMRQTIAASGTVPFVQLLTAIALAIVIYFALFEAGQGRMQAEDFVAFVTAMLMLLSPLKALADINVPLQRGLAAAESVFALLDQKPEDDSGQQVLKPADGRSPSRIEFRGVGLRYPDTERDALAKIDLDIAPGETVALVGASGSGKTTLANLVLRFYHASAGQILVDGHDVKELTLASLRSHIAMVSQEVVLFNDTVAANIAYGALRDAPRARIVAAAEAANAMAFIEQMPQGLDTEIGENGVKLSGGQRQRIAIARALLKDAPILVLDEATSALDSESERKVQAALEVLMHGRTTLVIAHRLSTIENADRIIVLQQGRIVEAGTHQALLAQDGTYANLHRLQRSEQGEAAA